MKRGLNTKPHFTKQTCELDEVAFTFETAPSTFAPCVHTKCKINRKSGSV